MSLEFEKIISILSEDLDVDLFLDANQSCCLVLNDDVKIQFELDKSKQNIIIASYLIDLAPGKFREIVLKAALRSNFGPDKGIGILSYIPKTTTLVMFESIPLNFLKEDQVFILFMSFYKKCKVWIENIKNNSIPDMSYSKGDKPSLGKKA